MGGIVGIGVDAVDVDRVRRALERQPGLAERLFTEAERAYGGGSKNPAPHLAARFAAKEAVLKALAVGLGAASFTDIEVRRAEGGQPVLHVSGAAAALAATRGVRRWHLSLTHTENLAVAYVIAEGGAGEPVIAEGGAG